MDYSNNSKYLIDAEQKWFNVKLPIRQCSLKELANATFSKEDLDNLSAEAQQLLDEETAARQSERGRWYTQQFLSRGTTSDRIASAAVKLSENDFMFFIADSFALLFDTARNDSHHYEAALKALAAVWPRLMPPRPLKRFIAQYFTTLPSAETNPEDRKKVLIYWYLEDLLKRTYSQFLSLAEASMKDKLAVRRESWLDTIGKVLNLVAEGRPVVISLLVDKLGDPLSSVSHKSYHLLLNMLSESSLNQALLQTELERVAFLKGCPPKTIKYCVNVMNQLVFNKDERKLALKCVQSYLSLFRQMILMDSIDQSVTNAVIVGLRRAFPYSGADFSVLEHHLNSLFILANTGNFTQRVSSLALLQQLLKGGAIQLQHKHKETQIGFDERWYRALYQLLLISPYQLPHSSQLSGFFSLLHKALRSDKNLLRVAAFTHRLLQRCMFHKEAFVCAALLLVSELVQSYPLIRQLLSQNPPHPKPETTEAAAEEKVKAPKGSSKEVRRALKLKQKAAQNAADEASAAVAAETRAKNKQDYYDAKAREPQFARAQKECYWTLNALSRHSHPAVVKITVLLLLGEEVVFDSHPLDDLTITNFLQMFADAKSTMKSGDEGTTTGGNKGVAVFRRTIHVAANPSAADALFVSAAPESVDVTALFLHRYAVQRHKFLDALTDKKNNPWGDGKADGEDYDILASDDEEEEKPKKKKRNSKKDSVEDDEAIDVTEKDEDAEVVASRVKAGQTAALFGPDTTADKKKAKKGKAAEEEEDDEPANEIEDSEDEGSDDGFDADFADDESLDWGSDDEHALDDVDDGEDSLDDVDEGESDDEEKGQRGLGGHDEGEGEDFGRIVDSHVEGPSKKKLRQDKYLEKNLQSGSFGQQSYTSSRGGRGGYDRNKAFSGGRGGGRGGRGSFRGARR
eukprot:GILI01016012.1.p1 GENE.GILI01016012.1~~GILI01016012.1.p1  ORF type:complete len:913 (-),score=297.73 GILI01016012.1:94-2832(-)